MPVAEVFLSAFITVLFDKLASGELLDLARQGGIRPKLKKWSKALLKIQAVLSDAEEKQITDRAVKIWLDDLQDLAYDLDDIVDELATEVLLRKLVPQPQSDTCKVWYAISPCCTNRGPTTFSFNYTMRTKVDEISARLQEISQQKIGLVVEGSRGGFRASNITEKMTQVPSTSLKPRVFGREKEKEEILKLLFKGGENMGVDDVCVVIPILGMGGIGKTALAQEVYNDDEVNHHFDLKSWVCVSVVFDVSAITKTILVSLSSESDMKDYDLNMLQVKLMKKLSGKKFLFVLDDIWNEDYDKWEVLRRPFLGGAPGSKIIATARNERVASIMSFVAPFRLKVLGAEHCLSLLALHALGRTNFDAHPNLKVIADELVKKCGGLPLAIKSIGGVLRTKQRQNEWEDVLNNKMWKDEVSGILPALLLSYHHLPFHLKQCFAYCSIIPKDYTFDKNELVLLWMAADLLENPGGSKQIEDLGREHFEDLLSRSFFQLSIDSDEQFVMHDLMNDLAQHVAGKICFKLEDKLEGNQLERARHSSYICQKFDVFKKFTVFGEVPRLRTFLSLPAHELRSTEVYYLSNKVLVDLLPKLQCLRVLSLRGYQISELPNSINALNHLRYLNLSYTSIKWLPESVGTLYNLQTLSVRKCRYLRTLPKSIGNLINLRHLDNAYTHQLQKIPSGISKLTSLQTLPKIVVEKDAGFRIQDVKDLMLLRGTLHIEELQNVTDFRDAKNANLRSKQYLDKLGLVWATNFDDSREERLEMEVLDMLQPHKSLKQLNIEYYGGVKFPSWTGDLSFSNVVKISLRGCKRCTSLPSVGQLPLLKVLDIRSMHAVKSVGDEFYMNGSSVECPFPSLETLRFNNMPEWEEWSCLHVDEEIGGQLFPHLRELTIDKCPKLRRTPLLRLPSLCKLNLQNCSGVLLNRFADLTSLISLEIESVTELTYLNEEFMQSSGALEDLVIIDCHQLVCLWPKRVLVKKLLRLKNLSVQGCDQLISLGDEEQGLPSNLEVLKLIDCGNLEKLPNVLNNLKSLRDLTIYFCPKLVSFPVSPMLRSLVIERCHALVSLTNYMFNSRLEELRIYDCSSLRLLPVSKSGTTLKKLEVKNCVNVEAVMWLDSSSSSSGGGSSSVTSVEQLRISNCTNKIIQTLLFGSSRSARNLAGLVDLHISDCSDMESFPERKFSAPYLRKLDISYCTKLNSLHVGMQSLPCLKSLCIVGCPTLSSLDDGIESFASLESLIICKCQNLEFFSNDGFPANLKTLDIRDCDRFKPLSDWCLHKLTSLQAFTIRGAHPELVSFSFSDDNDEFMLPSSLTVFTIFGLPYLKSLSKGLQNLSSLEELVIFDCPMLQSLPKDDLLDTLSRLQILGCPLLTQRCLKDKGDYWPRIAHIPLVMIDGKSIFEQSFSSQ